MTWTRTFVVLGVVVLSATGSLSAQPQVLPAADQAAQNLRRLTLEELSEIDVTTASRRVERLSDAAAAIVVIRQEDIRRAGVTTLADAMRLADAVQVSQVYGPGWAISARGFNTSTSNKLLVLIDGRTVYSPLFSGVFWDVQDLVLDDIDRIEVIRGPGGTLWGANAVNGVINVITKAATDSLGGMAKVSVGNQTNGVVSFRYGDHLGAGAYRLYGKVRAEGAQVFATGQSGKDDSQFVQTGFRAETDRTASRRWLVQGDLYRGQEGLYDRPDTKVAGGNILTRWERSRPQDGDTRVQVYYDRTYRRVQRQYESTRDTFDIDMQQQWQAALRHAVVFGAGFRSSRGDDLGDGPGFFFAPQVRTSNLFSLFAQDEIALSPGRAVLTLGSKVERNDFTGWEFQPNVRGRWTLTPRQTLWGAVSRAVRVPTRFDTDLRILVPNTGVLFLTGSESFQSENVTAYEAGYRARPSEWISFDVATYVNQYGDLRSQELPLTAGQPIVLANLLNARTSGVELGTTLMFGSWWEVHGSYSYMWERFSRDPDSRDVTGGSSEANDPSHLFAIRSFVDLPRGLQLDGFFRYTSALPNPPVDAYAELNLRLGWRIRRSWDLSLVGQNLVHDRHAEFAGGTPREEFVRAASIRSTWRF